MKFMKQILVRISKIVSAWLLNNVQELKPSSLTDFDKICASIKLGDVLLVAGRSRASQVITMVTQSRWSHASIYIGRYNEITDVAMRATLKKFYSGSDNEQLLIESQMGKGVIITPLKSYRLEETRLCRPTGLNHKDAQKLLGYCINRLGLKYDMRQIFDLARFLFPWGILPRLWRTSLFRHNAGEPTHATCSLLLAEAFAVVRYPILPDVIYSETSEVEVVQRNARLFTPCDFDESPFFDIIKFPIFDLSDTSIAQKIHWRDDLMSNDDNGLVKLNESSIL